MRSMWMFLFRMLPLQEIPVHFLWFVLFCICWAHSIFSLNFWRPLMLSWNILQLLLLIMTSEMLNSSFYFRLFLSMLNTSKAAFHLTFFFFFVFMSLLHTQCAYLCDITLQVHKKVKPCAFNSKTNNKQQTKANHSNKCKFSRYKHFMLDLASFASARLPISEALK